MCVCDKPFLVANFRNEFFVNTVSWPILFTWIPPSLQPSFQMLISVSSSAELLLWCLGIVKLFCTQCKLYITNVSKQDYLACNLGSAHQLSSGPVF